MTSDNGSSKEDGHEFCPKPPPIFVREATGLVRDIGFRGVLGYSLGFFFVLISFSFGIPIIIGVNPGANLYIGLILSWLIQLVTVFGYSFLVMTMPRSGGDYIYTSRALHPAVGFMSGWSWLLTGFLFTSTALFSPISFLLSVFLGIVGLVTRNPGLSSLAGTITQPLNFFLIGLVVAVILTVVAITGLRWTVRLMSISALASIIGSIILLIVFAAGTPSGFSSGFLSYTGHSISNVTAEAAKEGYSTAPSLATTFSSVPLWMVFFFAGTQYMVYLGGEVKAVKKNMILALLINMLIGLVLFAIILFVFLSIVGNDFFASLSYLWIAGSKSYPMPGGYIPSAVVLGYVLNGNLAVFDILSLIGVFIGFTGYLVYLPWISRVFFAMSFDRMLPSWFASVSERFHHPVKATIVTSAAAVATLPLWITGFASTWLNGSIVLALIYLIAGLACIALPFTMKEQFAKSPANYKIGKIPIISLLGVIMVITWGIVVAVAFGNPNYGTLGLPVYTATAAMFVGGAVYYYAVKAYRRKKEGIDVRLIFKEIPPE